MNTIRGLFGPWLVPTDSVQCSFCKKVRLFTELIPVKGKSFAKSDGNGVWQSVFYHCPCDLDHPLAYDEGRGEVQLVEDNASLQHRDF